MNRSAEGKSMKKRIVLPLLLLPTSAFAHAGHGDSLIHGFTHPLLGADHVLAMIAVGLWAALVGGRALWFWPLGFVAAMIAGFGLGAQGITLPLIEPMILASVIGLGAVVALVFRPAAIIGLLPITIFGLFHGLAHGLEIDGAALPSFAAGFVVATTLLHAAGGGLGVLLTRDKLFALRLAGLAVAGGGLSLALGG
jgi:urease accessory protein